MIDSSLIPRKSRQNSGGAMTVLHASGAAQVVVPRSRCVATVGMHERTDSPSKSKNKLAKGSLPTAWHS
jgi:hypothetical protein